MSTVTAALVTCLMAHVLAVTAAGTQGSPGQLGTAESCTTLHVCSQAQQLMVCHPPLSGFSATSASKMLGQVWVYSHRQLDCSVSVCMDCLHGLSASTVTHLCFAVYHARLAEQYLIRQQAESVAGYACA